MITFSPGAVHRKQAPNGNFCNKVVLMSNGFSKSWCDFLFKQGH